MEIWDIYDVDRIKTGRTIVRGEPLADGDYHLVVHIWVMNSQGEFLIQKRNENLKLKPGMWASTGGSATVGEGSLLSAYRELKEELGLDIDQSDFKLIRSFKRKDNHTDVYLVEADIDIESLVYQEEEVECAKWMTVSDIKRLICDGKFVYHGESYLENICRYSYQKRLELWEIANSERLKIINCDYEMVKDVYYSQVDASKIFGFDINVEAYQKLKKIMPVFKNLMEHNEVYEKWYLWVIINKKFNCLIGDIGFKGKPTEAGEVEIGYGISSSFRNSGFATEAVSTLSDWVFRQPDVKVLKANCTEDNIASATVLDKNEMKIQKIEDNVVSWEKTI